jgi:CSLREA domain-containing protein
MNKMLRFSIPVLAALLALAALFFIMGASAQAAAGGRASTQTAIIATSLDDELNSDGDCALREAIQAVNTNAAVDACPAVNVLADTITFAVAGTITVTTQLEILASGGPLMIDGGEVITVSGGGSSGVFRVLGGIALTIQRLAVTDGYAFNSHGAGLYDEGGYIIIDPRTRLFAKKSLQLSNII